MREWVDEKVVTDGNLITSRNPDDIPDFNNALLEALEHGAAGTSSYPAPGRQATSAAHGDRRALT